VTSKLCPPPPDIRLFRIAARPATGAAAGGRRRPQHALGREHDAARVAQRAWAARPPLHERRVRLARPAVGAPHAAVVGLQSWGKLQGSGPSAEHASLGTGKQLDGGKESVMRSSTCGRARSSWPCFLFLKRVRLA
jgi:hypothetical protein